MKFIALDTTTKFLGIGLSDGERAYAYSLETGTKLSTLLLPHLERLCAALKWKIRDIDYFSCGIGPGSFTGVRIGLAAVKGLAWSLQKPMIGLPTLDILAANAKGGEGLVVPVIDARRGLLYSSVYTGSARGMSRRAAFMLLTPDELLKKLAVFHKGSRSVFFLGDGASVYRDLLLRRCPKAVILDKDCWYPRGGALVELTLERIRAKKFDDPFKLKPLYLYAKECQVRNRV